MSWALLCTWGQTCTPQVPTCTYRHSVRPPQHGNMQGCSLSPHRVTPCHQPPPSAMVTLHIVPPTPVTPLMCADTPCCTHSPSDTSCHPPTSVTSPPAWEHPWHSPLSQLGTINKICVSCTLCPVSRVGRGTTGTDTRVPKGAQGCAGVKGGHRETWYPGHLCLCGVPFQSPRQHRRAPSALHQHPRSVQPP